MREAKPEIPSGAARTDETAAARRLRNVPVYILFGLIALLFWPHRFALRTSATLCKALPTSAKLCYALQGACYALPTSAALLLRSCFALLRSAMRCPVPAPSKHRLVTPQRSSHCAIQGAMTTTRAHSEQLQRCKRGRSPLGLVGSAFGLSVGSPAGVPAGVPALDQRGANGDPTG